MFSFLGVSWSYYMSHFSVFFFAVPLLLLVTNRKVLILHEQNMKIMVYVKSLNVGASAHTVLTELDDQKLLSCGMASIKSTASYIS